MQHKGYFTGLPYFKLLSSHAGQKQLAMDLQNHSRDAVSSNIDHFPVAYTSGKKQPFTFMDEVLNLIK